MNCLIVQVMMLTQHQKKVQMSSNSCCKSIVILMWCVNLYHSNKQAAAVILIMYIPLCLVNIFSKLWANLAFHTTYVMCINFIHEWRDLPNDRFFEKRLLIYSQNICQFEVAMVGSMLAYQMKNQGSNPRPDIVTKYEKYFFDDFLSSDF